MKSKEIVKDIKHFCNLCIKYEQYLGKDYTKACEDMLKRIKTNEEER